MKKVYEIEFGANWSTDYVVARNFDEARSKAKKLLVRAKREDKTINLRNIPVTKIAERMEIQDV